MNVWSQLVNMFNIIEKWRNKSIKKNGDVANDSFHSVYFSPLQSIRATSI